MANFAAASASAGPTSGFFVRVWWMLRCRYTSAPSKRPHAVAASAIFAVRAAGTCQARLLFVCVQQGQIIGPVGHERGELSRQLGLRRSASRGRTPPARR